jgi:hypothetical protein
LATSETFKELPKENNHPIGKNSPNLFTLNGNFLSIREVIDSFKTGLPDFSYNIPKRGENYTKLPQNFRLTGHIIGIPNARNIFRMAINYTNVFHFKALSKFTQIRIFGVKNTIWQPWAKRIHAQARQR